MFKNIVIQGALFVSCFIISKQWGSFFCPKGIVGVRQFNGVYAGILALAAERRLQKKAWNRDWCYIWLDIV